MPSHEERTVILSASEAESIEALVNSGRYHSASEVVREALLALEERDAETDQWLKEEVLPVYDAYHADPGRAIPAEEVFAELRAHHAVRQKTIKRHSA